MEEDQEQKKFVCKVCSKSFFSGRSLGGHMRGHLAINSTKEHEDHNGDDGYGLRDNPKKSWRVSDGKQSIAFVRQENHCKECGKEFPSTRALSGHMRCHSIKPREGHVCKQCGKGFVSMRALFGHMRHHPKRSRVSDESAETQSGYETVRPILRNRSSTRYKITRNFPLSNLNASSFVSEIDEVEEAAVCLMMLSSENYSVMFRAKALHQSKDGELVCNADETRKMKNPRERLDSCVLCSENSLFEKNESEFDVLGSGFMSNNEKMNELELSIDGLDDESGIESSDVEIENESEPMRVVEMMKSKSSEEGGFDVQELELGGKTCAEINYAASISEIFGDSPKKCEYRCRTCNKIFHSYQALGGHQTSHKTISSGFVVKIECHDQMSVETDLLLNTTEANPKLEEQGP